MPTETGVTPACAATVWPTVAATRMPLTAMLVAYMKSTVVSAPLGFMVPFRVALVAVMLVAAVVTPVGAIGQAAVVNTARGALLMPDVFDAKTNDSYRVLQVKPVMFAETAFPGASGSMVRPTPASTTLK